MPIRPELRHLYQGPHWAEVRRRILTRAGGRFNEEGKYLGGARCEKCRRPDRRRVWVLSGEKSDGLLRRNDLQAPDWAGMRFFDQYWSLVKGDGARWHSSSMFGQRFLLKLRASDWKLARLVRVQLGVAHINGVAGDDRDENLAAWCRWCHLIHDRFQHKETRSIRKDAGRPLLEVAS